MFTLNLRNRLLLILVLLGLVPLALFGGFSYQQAKKALERKEMEHMMAVRDLKVREIEAYFQQMEGQVRTLSRSPIVVEALQQLPVAFGVLLDQLPKHANVNGIDDESAGLRDFYQQQVLSSLSSEEAVAFAQIYPASPTTHHAQSLYISDNPFEIGQKEWLNDAGDGSDYSRLHNRIHPILRDYRQEFGYYDIFLVDLKGDLLYSVVKEIDFATNLTHGPHRDTALGKAWQLAMEEEDRDAVVMNGLERYLPSQMDPAGFLASPIYDHEGEERLGVLLFQFPLDRINTIVQDRQGMEEGSEVVLGMQVGEALTFLNQLLFSDEEALQKRITIGSGLALPMQYALQGMVDSGFSVDYENNQVLAAWAPVTRLGWGLVAKINREQALMGAMELLYRTVVSLGLLILIILPVAWRGAVSIVGPIESLSRRFAEVRKGHFDVQAKVVRNDELGQLAESFNRMTEGLYNTTTSLKNLEEILASMGEGVLVLDANGKVQLSNPAFSQLSGYETSWIRKQYADAIRALFVSEERLFQGVFNNRETMMISIRGKVPVLLSRSLLISINGDIEGEVLVCSDLRDRKRMEEQEQDAAFQAGVAEMSASVLHNIGNTVTGSISHVMKLRGLKKGMDIVTSALQQGNERSEALLSNDAAMADPVQMKAHIEWAGRVFRSTAKVVGDSVGEDGLGGVEEKLGKSIQHIGEIISLQQKASKGGTHITQFALEQTVLDCQEMIQDSLDRYGIQFEIRLAPELQYVTLPRNPFMQMVLNLIKNSMESIRSRLGKEQGLVGKIEVEGKVLQDNQFILVVRDNGVGIDPEVKKSLFTFGFTTKAEGSGFGLHASGNFVKSLGGDIEIRSDGINQGVTIVVTLPLHIEKND